MKPKLPRVLLWTNIESIDDFPRMSKDQSYYDLLVKVQMYTNYYYSERKTVQIMNEAFYQVTKIVYEKNNSTFFPDVLLEIKSKIEYQADQLNVLILIYAILLSTKYDHDSNRKCSNVIGEYLRQPYPDIVKLVLQFTSKEKNKFLKLKPKPCAVNELKGLFIKWDYVTRDFNVNTIGKLLKLWNSNKDRLEVLNLLEREYTIFRNSLRFISEGMDAQIPPIADFDYFIKGRKALEGESHVITATKKEAAPSRTYNDLCETIKLLKNKISEIESDNERLRSKQNSVLPQKDQERTFSLSLIVDYCKKNLTYKEASIVSKMLNKFLRDARDYTDEECAMVDSIDGLFLNRTLGNIQITMNSPQIQDFYRITGNENVNLGEYQNGEEE